MINDLDWNLSKSNLSMSVSIISEALSGKSIMGTAEISYIYRELEILV